MLVNYRYLDAIEAEGMLIFSGQKDESLYVCYALLLT